MRGAGASGMDLSNRRLVQRLLTGKPKSLRRSRDHLLPQGEKGRVYKSPTAASTSSQVRPASVESRAMTVAPLSSRPAEASTRSS